jgi:60 kDa SS-A/Ro ribonucleoprotein
MTNYLNIFSRRTATTTPQALPIPGTIPNSAGGHAFPVDDWARLDRFLILGSEGGSYYASERDLTRDNAQAVLRAIQADGERAVARIVDISVSGRAPKNDPALFALALAASSDDLATRRSALAALPKVARTGTHLFQFAELVQDVRG